MSDEKARDVIKEIIKEVIEKEKLRISGEEKKDQVKVSIIEKLFSADTYKQGKEGETTEIIEQIVCHLIDAVVTTFNFSFGKNWLLKIFGKIF